MEVLFKAVNTPASVAADQGRMNAEQAYVSLRSRTAVLPHPLPSRLWTALAFLAADAMALGCVGMLHMMAGDLLLTSGVASASSSLLIALPFLGVAYGVSGLYLGSSLHPAEEMRRVVLSTAVALGAFTAAFIALEGFDLNVAAYFALMVCIMPLFVATCRMLSRILCARMKWWGYPVVVVGNGSAGPNVVGTLRRWPELGLKPVALLSDTAPVEAEVEGVPVCGRRSDAPAIALEYGIPCAVLPIGTMSHEESSETVGYYSRFYERLLVIPDATNMSVLFAGSWFFGGVVGYGMQHRQRRPLSLFIKRLIDIVCATAGILLLLPFWLVIATLIKMDSGGPVFYRQVRIGRGGRIFNVLKFRSMYVDASHRLQEILTTSTGLREEYEVYRKLRDDPRVTRMGRFLRRYSLDELPQLVNILRGEMSIVGPRAYTPNEVASMQNMEGIIAQNAPGLTGLWQVSGRNNLSFGERVSIDVQYTKSWSIWLDAFIVLRTIPVVLSGEGAC